MSTPAPAPLTPVDCDLRDFAFMPLDVRRLRDSDLAGQESPEACWAAVLLWGAAWHQVPAASLPDDDKVLAHLAGYGRDVAKFRKVKAGALRGFVLCEDGRLYHPTVAEKAIEAWSQRQDHQEGVEHETDRKKREREDRKRMFAELRAAGVVPSWNIKTSDLRKLHAETCHAGAVTGAVTGDTATGHAGHAVVTARTGTGTGTGTDSSEPNGSAAILPFDPDRRAWADGVTLLTTRAGLSEPAAKKFIGGLLSRFKIKARDLLPPITTALVNGTPDPQGYLTAAAKRIASGASGSLPFGRGNLADPVPL